MSKQQNEDKYIVIGTKTSPEFAETFQRICEARELNMYAVVQMMIEAFVRYTDDRHNLSPNMEKLMGIFEHMANWKQAFNLADPSAKPEIYEATYYLGDPKKKGMRAVHIDRPILPGGKFTQTANVQQILERTLNLLLPEMYRRLRYLAASENKESIYEFLSEVIDEMTPEKDMQALRQQFEDNARGENGIQPNDTPYRRKQRRSIDMYESQQMTFDDFFENDNQ